MLFWRTKSVKNKADDQSNADTPEDQPSAMPDVADEAPASNDHRSDASDSDGAVADDAEDVTSAVAVTTSVPLVANTKLVTISPANAAASARLSDRLAGVGGSGAGADSDPAEPNAEPSAATEFIAPATTATAPGQAAALAELRAALATPGQGAHVLVLGTPGSGRKASADVIAQELAHTLARPDDWIYALIDADGGVLKPFPVPAGTAERLVRDIREAFAKSAAMLARIVESDHHQLALAMLEEDHRHRGEAPFEALKRRAEAQNIALVKTAEGYMVAPMHEGKVVRADVFRALPEALQRDVEAKVTALEAELQQAMGGLGGNDVATDDRHLALAQQAAERAVKPNMAVVRKLAVSPSHITQLLDALEADWTRRAVQCVRRGTDARTVVEPFIQAAVIQRAVTAPVVMAHAVSAADLLGEVGRDGTGCIAIRPGLLMRANGGFLIVDAWRCAADPAAWPALSAALEAGDVTPLSASGLAVTADAIPLNVKLVLIAEGESFANLQARDPRIAQHFGGVVRFADTATAFDVADSIFAEWLAALAKALSIRRLKSGAALPLYEDARSRAGDRSRVSLDIASLVQALRIADALAADAGRDAIGRADVERALQRRSALHSAEQAT